MTTRDRIIRKLQAAGIKRVSGSYQDYEWAKLVCFKDGYYSPEEYEKIVGYIASYLKI